MKRWNPRGWFTIIVATLLLTIWPAAARPVTLDQLIEAAIDHDPWLDRSQSVERALRAEAIAAGELPDPQLSASLANLPVDSFDFSQEPMTQLMLGVVQPIPGGDTRQLSRRKLEETGDKGVIERRQREAWLAMQITQTWLDALLAHQTIRLIEEDRTLFEQLVDVTRSGYGAAIRRVNQQDLIRAQLELTRLSERILQLQQQKEERLEQLHEWVPPEVLNAEMAWTAPVADVAVRRHIEPAMFIGHPEVLLAEQQVEIARIENELAEESRVPGWRVNASYAFRDHDRTGRDLPDFISVGVTMDLPLFKRNRQDQRVKASAERVAAAESARLLELRELTARYRDARASIARLRDQQALYDESLLQQLSSLAQSALDAYSADQGDFADVMRAHIAQLGARIEHLRLGIAIRKHLAELEYLTAGTELKGE